MLDEVVQIRMAVTKLAIGLQGQAQTYEVTTELIQKLAEGEKISREIVQDIITARDEDAAQLAEFCEIAPSLLHVIAELEQQATVQLQFDMAQTQTGVGRG